MARRKAEKLPLPQTTEAAIGVIAEYATLDAGIEQLRSRAEAKIAAIRAQCDLDTAPLEISLKERFNQLKPWWAVEGDALTEGKRKSMELGGCLIGHRTTPPKVDHPRPEASAIAILSAAGYEGLLRVKYELDKPALVRLLGSVFDGGTFEGVVFDSSDGDALLRDDQERVKRLGFSLVQKEEFFIDRIPPKALAVEIVAAPAEQVPA